MPFGPSAVPFRGASLLPVLFAFLLYPSVVFAQAARPGVAGYEDVAQQIIAEALKDSSAHDRLAFLADTFGPRFSGTDSLERAIDWVLSEMRRDGLESVRGEEVMVPRWVRGAESLEMIAPRPKPMAVLGLGGSIGTLEEGVTAEVLVVRSFEELNRRAAEAEGKIIVYNVPFTTYGETVPYRYRGADEASRVGAVASLVRSIGPVSLYTPHTGAMRYGEGVRRIPSAAITIEDAELLARMQARGQRARLTLRMDAHTLPDVPSRNVVAEIQGRERPEEVVVLGGHIDSWDVGQGAQDDAAGCVAAWEAVRVIKALGLRPRRTLRVVLWTNEENGLRGATGYRDAHRDEIDGHVLAIESDGGTFKPTGFAFTGAQEAFPVLREIGALLNGIEAGEITSGGGGADIGPLMELGVPGMNIAVENSRYFWYHHTNADAVDKVDPRDLALNAAAMAVMAYVVADLPERLPRAGAAN